MLSFKEYFYLNEAISDEGMDFIRSQEVRGGTDLERAFHKYALARGFKVRQSTEQEDRVERWDYKLQEIKENKVFPAFYENNLNVKYGGELTANLKGTVDVKTTTFNRGRLQINLIRNGIGESSTMPVNWMGIRDTHGFLLIHLPCFQSILKRTANVEFRNINSHRAEIVSLDPSRPVVYTNNPAEVSAANAVFYNNDNNIYDNSFVSIILREDVVRRFSINI